MDESVCLLVWFDNEQNDTGFVVRTEFSFTVASPCGLSWSTRQKTLSAHNLAHSHDPDHGCLPSRFALAFWFLLNIVCLGMAQR